MLITRLKACLPTTTRPRHILLNPAVFANLVLMPLDSDDIEAIAERAAHRVVQLFDRPGQGAHELLDSKALAREMSVSVDYVGPTPLPSQRASTPEVGSDDRLLGELADELADRLAGQVADQVAARLEGVSPGRREALIDAQEVARLTGRTREWVYDHQGELGAIRLGSGPKPRLGFDPAQVLAHMERVDDPAPVTMPPVAKPSRRRQRAGRTAAGAELLRIRGHES
jgi:hypothetical protein